MTFMATSAVIILVISTLVLSHGTDAFASRTDLFLLLLIALGAFVAAASLLLRLRAGRSLTPVHSPQGPIAQMAWEATLGDPAARLALHQLRDNLRAAVAVLPSLPPDARAQVRSAYSYTLEALARLRADLASPSVVSADGVAAVKAGLLGHLETEIASWDGDFAWFEQVEARTSA